MHRNIRYAWIALLLPMLLSTAAVAGDDDRAAATAQDVRCVVLALRLSGSDDAVMRASGMATTMYYLGRLDADAPGIDLESTLADAITKMTPDDLRAAGLTCGQTLMDRGKALTEAGQGLVKRGQQAAHDANIR